MKKYIKSETTQPKKLYEVEVLRRNVSPRQFFAYCEKKFKEKAGTDIDCWISYEDWINPIRPEDYHRYEHTDWDPPATEAIKYQPYDCQMYLSNAYNFMMEYEFGAGNNDGWGYMYAVEYER